MIEVLQEAEVDAEALQAERRQSVREESERELQRRYGPNYATQVNKANDLARSLLPAGGSRQLCELRLADGSVLGDNPLFIRLMIEFAREAL